MLLVAGAPASAQGLKFTGGIGLGTTYDTNLERQADGSGAVGLGATADAQLRAASGPADFQLGYGITLYRYEERPDRDRTSHRGRAALTFKLSRHLALATVAEAKLGGMSEDREVGTEYSFSPRLDLNLGARNRIRLRAMHRIRRFGDLSGKDAVNQGLGIDYRVGHSDRPRMEMGSRYDVSETSDPRSEFQRWSHRVMFTAPVSKRIELALGASQTNRTYPKRLVELEPIGSLDLDDDERRQLEFYQPDDSGSIPLDEMPDDLFLRWRDLPRHDEIWTPSASISLRAANGIQVRLIYEMEVRLSNDLRRGYSGHSVELWTGFSF